MGCGSSSSTRSYEERGIYEQLAVAIRRYETPQAKHMNLVTNNDRDEFRRPNKEDGKLSLLVIAIAWQRWEWYSLLLKKCDPHVEWKLDDGRKFTIQNELARVQPDERRDELFGEWTVAKEQWTKWMSDAETEADGSEMMENRFPKASAALALLAVTATGAMRAMGGGTVPAPVTAACTTVLEKFFKDVHEWKQAKDDGRFMFVAKDGVTTQLDNTLSRIFELQRKRIQVTACDKTYQANVVCSVENMSTLLGNLTKRMKVCLSSPGGREDTERRDAMMTDMLATLVDWQAQVMSAYNEEVRTHAPPVNGHTPGAGDDCKDAGDNQPASPPESFHAWASSF